MKNNNTLWAIVGVIAVIILVVILSKSGQKDVEVNEDGTDIDVSLGIGGGDLGNPDEDGEVVGEETTMPPVTPSFPQTGFPDSE